MEKYEYEIVQYHSGTRFVVLARNVYSAGSDVVYGPDSYEACRSYVVGIGGVFAADSFEASKP